jgi:nucleoid DNA-binding protein
MNTINKKTLVKVVSKDLSLTQNVVSEILNAIFDQIKEEYRKGNRIEIREFGTFSPYLRKSKIYQNPKTLKLNSMPTRTMLKFKGSKQLYY